MTYLQSSEIQGQDPKGRFGVSFRSPHPLAPLDAAKLKKTPTQSRINIILAAMSKMRHSLFPWAVEITDSKCKRAEPKHVKQILKEIPAPRAWTPHSQEIWVVKGERMESPKSSAGTSVQRFSQFYLHLPTEFCSSGINKTPDSRFKQHHLNSLAQLAAPAVLGRFCLAHIGDLPGIYQHSSQNCCCAGVCTPRAPSSAFCS